MNELLVNIVRLTDSQSQIGFISNLEIECKK